MDLQSIAVNGQLLAIDHSAFTASDNQGTIIDSGTTLAYLIEEAYDPFIKAVSLFEFVTLLENGNRYLKSIFVVQTQK